jgi:hypothetical protein
MIKQFVNIILHRGDTKDAPVSLDSILDPADQHLADLDQVILPAPESRPRTPFNANLPKEEMSMMNFTLRQRMQVLPKMVPLVANMQLGARMYHRKFKPTRSAASPEFLAQFESLARAMGAKDIGYVKVPRNAIFQGKGIPAEYAIVFTVEMEKAPLSSAPSFECQLASRAMRRSKRALRATRTRRSCESASIISVLSTEGCVLRAACCVLRAACCVLRAACCVLRAAC